MRGKRCALAERREIVGHTQESLARFVGVEPTTVGRWERGENSPQPFVRGKLSEALKVSVEQLDDLLAEGQPVKEKPVGNTPQAGELSASEPPDDRVLSAPWSHRGTVEAAVLLRGGDQVKRRVFGWLTGLALTAPAHQWLVHEPGPLVSGLSGRRVPAGLVDRFTAMIAELRRIDDVAGGGTVLTLAQHEFDLVAGLLDRAVYDERTGRALHILLAELGQLAGWAAYDGGYHPLAQRYWIAALRATHNADERVLGAHILGNMAEQAARHGQPAEAVTLIDTAVAGTRGQHTPALLAKLYGGQAYALATLGDTSGCAAANSKLSMQIERLGSVAEPSYLYWVNLAPMTGEVGNALRQLGQADRAVPVLNEAIALFDGSLPRDSLGYRIHLANALTMPGKQRDLDAAVARGMEAIQIVETLDSPRSVGLIRDLGRQMAPHAKVPAVRDFVARARELVPAAQLS